MARDLTTASELSSSDAVHPHYRETLHTYVQHLGMKIVSVPHDGGVTREAAVRARATAKTAAVIVQYPNVFGCIEDGAALASAAHDAGALLVVAIAEPISLGLLQPPGALEPTSSRARVSRSETS